MNNLNFIIENIEKDKEVHRKLVKDLSKKVRFIPTDLLIDKYNAFYVPNNKYIESMCKDCDVKRADLNLYYKNQEGNFVCKYYKRLVIPITDLRGNVRALCGYHNNAEVKYLYSNSKVWKKENYIFCGVDDIENALEEGYMFFSDGLFDKIIVEYLEYISSSFMGSHVSKFHKDLLSYIKHPILLTDSDSAGRKLLQKMKKANPNTIEFRMIGQYDDIYDYLVESEENRKYFKRTFEEAKREGFTLNKELR